MCTARPALSFSDLHFLNQPSKVTAMPRKAENLFSTARGRVRASMNKVNLFNLYKKNAVKYNMKTLYQQKWLAKQESRAYHGEHLGEKRWKAIFQPSLNSVAQLDASLQGKEVSFTPNALQTYAVLEKRLEVALFRAMFASSIRQAREFIKGGYVKVNGVTMRHTSFPLKSGDVFSVKPEKVLLAMGRTKPSLEEAIKVDKKQIHAWNRYVKTAKEHPKEVWEMKQNKPASLDTLKEEATDKTLSANAFNEKLEAEMLEAQKRTTRESILSSILQIAKNQPVEAVTADMFKELLPARGDAEKALNAYKILKEAETPLLSLSSVEECRAYIATKSPDFENKAAAKTASQIRKILLEVHNSQLEELRVRCENSKLPDGSVGLPYTPDFAQKLKTHAPLKKDEIVENEEAAKIDLPWQKGLFGRQDPSKPYFTPWTPRPFIGPFAILPHHLEISFETCHAVYLADPVARPGHSEVISPYGLPTHERAFLYYARKGM